MVKESCSLQECEARGLGRASGKAALGSQQRPRGGQHPAEGAPIEAAAYAGHQAACVSICSGESASQHDKGSQPRPKARGQGPAAPEGPLTFPRGLAGHSKRHIHLHAGVKEQKLESAGSGYF